MAPLVVLKKIATSKFSNGAESSPNNSPLQNSVSNVTK